MTGLQIVFLITALGTLGAAVLVVSTRKLIPAALWLVLTLFGVAITFVLLEAEFFAMVQVVVYIGAIAVLMFFAIMLTRREMREKGPQTQRSWWLAAVISALLFSGIVWMLSFWNGFQQAAPMASVGPDALQQLGRELVSPDAYVIPFEVASILLGAALIGAIYVAWERN